MRKGKAMANMDRAVETLRRLPPESQELVARLVEQLARGASVDLASGYSPPAENVGAWVARLTSERKSERTIQGYRYLDERFLREHPRPTRLEVQGYLARRLGEGMSPTGVESERKSLSSLFGFLVEENLWHEDPTAGLKHIRVTQVEVFPPSTADIERVLEGGWQRAKDADKMRTIIVILATTGLRLTECLTALKENLDLEGRKLRVLGKGRKWRTVPLLETTRDVLLWYTEERSSDSPFIFPGEGRSGHAEIHNVEKTLKRACLRAGVRPFTPHQLRHYFATCSLRNGAKLGVVSRILGHADAGITSRVYRHIDEAEMREAVDEHAPPLNHTREPK